MENVDFDEKLWFYHLGCKGKHYILGNAHTVPGRLMAWCAFEKRSIFISKPDMGKMSKECRIWLDGFLNGSEPDPPLDEDGMPDFGSKNYYKWRRKADDYLKSGVWK